MTPYDVIRCHNYVMAWQQIKSKNGMEIMDGVDTDRWEVGMITEEK